MTTLILVLGDILLLYGAVFSVVYFRYGGTFEPWLILWQRHIIPFGIIFVFWILVFGAFGLYDLRFMKNGKVFLYRLLRAMATNVVLAIILFYLFPFIIEPRRNLFLIASFSTIFIFGWRLVFNLMLPRAPASRVLFWGITKEAVNLADYLIKNRQLGHKPVAFMSVDGEEPPTNLTIPIYASTRDLGHIIKDEKVDLVVALREIKENKTFVTMLFQAIPLGIGVVDFQAFYERIAGKIPLSLIGEVWFLENLIGVRRRSYEFFKRVLDMVVAIIVLTLGVFLLPFVAAAIKFDSKGPIFYRQKRVGRNGKEFLLIKFRSMVMDADKMSGFKGEGRDPRHTLMGTFLRKSYIDELPQVIHILKGEMSFVGPRPERPEYVVKLKQKIPFYEMRLLVPPGITGWAQINMENDASVEDSPEKLQYDLYYIKNRSFLLDFLIILKTTFTILRRKGR